MWRNRRASVVWFSIRMLKITERNFTPEERQKIEADRIPDNSGPAAKIVIYMMLLVLALPLSALGMILFGPLMRALMKGSDSAMTVAYLSSLSVSLYAVYRFSRDAALVQNWTSKPRFDQDLQAKRIEEIEISEIVAAKPVQKREALLITTSDKESYVIAAPGIAGMMPRTRLVIKRLPASNAILDSVFSGEPVQNDTPVPIDNVREFTRDSKVPTYGLLSLDNAV